MTKEPLFLRFINRELGVVDLLRSFSKSEDTITSAAAGRAMDNPPDIEEFRKELEDAVSDVVTTGLGEEFKAFVNHYMQESLIEDVEVVDSTQGENINRSARIKDEHSPWIQGFVCYNLCLYLKAYGTEMLKKCKICGKLFAHKGKYAIYCSDGCKAKGQKKTNFREKPDTSNINPFNPFSAA